VAVSRSRRARGSRLQHPPRQGVPIIRPQAHDCLHHRRQIDDIDFQVGSSG